MNLTPPASRGDPLVWRPPIIQSGRSSPDLDRPNFCRNHDCDTRDVFVGKGPWVDDGSQPRSLVSQSTWGPDDGGLANARSLVSSYINYKLSRRSPIHSCGEMKAKTESLLERYADLYPARALELPPDPAALAVSPVTAVAESMFADGVTNWGRVVALVAFGSLVCECLEEKGRGRCVDLVAADISAYLLRDRRGWLLEHGGWRGFEDFMDAYLWPTPMESFADPCPVPMESLAIPWSSLMCALTACGGISIVAAPVLRT